MALTKEQGFKIREKHSGELEKLVCDSKGLTQLGGSRTKIDGYDSNSRVSIKNFGGNSTQVHLTTKNNFIKVMDIDDNSSMFIKLFCGDKDTNNGVDKKGRVIDRLYTNQIPTEHTKSFKNYLKENTEKIIKLLICGQDDITHVIYRNTKTAIESELSYQEIIDKVKDCEWVFLKGGIHLKNKKGKTYFHLQREGKSKLSNRYNVLWHINKYLFI